MPLKMWLKICAFLIVCIAAGNCKLFNRCELGFELMEKGIVADSWHNEIPKWLCLANYSSLFDTSFFSEVGDSRTYGILKISNNWCDDGIIVGPNMCGVPCEQLQDDNISETVRCDSKEYTCTATNAEGTVTEVFPVEVLYQGTSEPTSTTELTTTTEPTTTELTTTTEPTTTTAPTTTTTPTTTTVRTTTTTAVRTTTTTTVRTTTTTINSLLPTPPPGPAIIYTACDLARKLTNLFDDKYSWDEELENWICLSERTTFYNASYLEISESDISRVFYGIFKISNGWCSDFSNSENLCGVECSELFDVEKSVDCARYIYSIKQFTEWPEFEKCAEIVPENLKWCTKMPYFVSTGKSETEKTFVELDTDKNVVCSAKGFPPPELTWDSETLKKIRESGNRVQLITENVLEDDGNWTMRSVINFTTVAMSDKHWYYCNASNIVGWDVLDYNVNVIKRPESTWEQALYIGGGVTISLLGLIAIPITYLLYRMKRKREKKLREIYNRFKYGSIGEKDTTQHDYLKDIAEYETYQRVLEEPFDKASELEPSRLQIDKNCVLGSGAFGVVFQGVLDQSRMVAVKTIAEGADESKFLALLSELMIMIYVGRHPNIVELVGAQTINLRRRVVNVAIELCPRGSLEQVLQTRRKQLAAEREVGRHQMAAIPGYLATPYKVKPFTRYQLLLFSHQVCCGMEFLASRKIIHGDLASRNVLLDANYVTKIADFGQSKMIYDTYQNYVIVPKEFMFPWRSLPLETLRRLKLSTESDVWAFGVFMWEVFSLAKVPYSRSIRWSPEFVDYLIQGFRLQIPKYASIEIYELMKKCWVENPYQRIRFQELSIKLLSLRDADTKETVVVVDNGLKDDGYTKATN